MNPQTSQRRGRKLHLKLRTIADLCRHIQVPETSLLTLAATIDHEPCILYRSWEYPKKSGGTRPIDAPVRELKQVQNQINRHLLQNLQVHSSAMGGVRGKNLNSNVRPHVGKTMVAKFDLENFFPTISSGRVYELFCTMGCSPDVARLLTRLTTIHGRVPQGAPTSTMIAVLVAGYGGAHSFNGRVEELAQRHRSDFTIWIDDVTFSGPAYLPNLARTIEHIARQCGFTVKQSKNQFLHQGKQQLVTGLVVNEKPNVPRVERRKLRAMLHICETQGPQMLAEQSTIDLQSHLRGKIAHIQQVNPTLGARLLAQFNAIDWSLRQAK
jgi:retron-type reverse transcriptase